MGRQQISVLAVSVAVLAAALSSPTTTAAPGLAARTIGEVVRLDPRLDHLVPPDAVIEVLADGFRWSEGPVWDREHRRVLFSDIPNNTVHSWSKEKGLEVLLKPSGYTEAAFLMAHAVQPDGSVAEGRVLFDMTRQRHALPHPPDHPRDGLLAPRIEIADLAAISMPVRSSLRLHAPAYPRTPRTPARDTSPMAPLASHRQRRRSARRGPR